MSATKTLPHGDSDQKYPQEGYESNSPTSKTTRNYAADSQAALALSNPAFLRRENSSFNQSTSYCPWCLLFWMRREFRDVRKSYQGACGARAVGCHLHCDWRSRPGMPATPVKSLRRRRGDTSWGKHPVCEGAISYSGSHLFDRKRSCDTTFSRRNTLARSLSCWPATTLPSLPATPCLPSLAMLDGPFLE